MSAYSVTSPLERAHHGAGGQTAEEEVLGLLRRSEPEPSHGTSLFKGLGTRKKQFTFSLGSVLSARLIICGVAPPLKDGICCFCGTLSSLLFSLTENSISSGEGKKLQKSCSSGRTFCELRLRVGAHWPTLGFTDPGLNFWKVEVRNITR